MLIFACAALLSFAATPVVRRVLHVLDLRDIPNARSSHTEVVARGGGLAVILGAVAGVAVTGPADRGPLVGLVAGSLVLGAIGLTDDRGDLAARTRLVGQFLTAAAALPLLLWGTARSGVVVVVLAATGLVWLVGYVNVFNFMDGINGISAAQGGIGGAALAVLGQRNDVDVATVGGLAISAACLGFAPFNAWRPKIFLGDVGSYFIGFWLAALVVVVVAGGADPLVAVAPFVLYVADATTTIVRRVRRGEDILSAHRGHAYQRLVQRGWSHVRVTALVGLLIAIMTLGMLAVDGRAPLLRLGVFAAALVTAIGFTVLPAALDGRKRAA